jgi:hypothetical protein
MEIAPKSSSLCRIDKLTQKEGLLREVRTLREVHREHRMVGHTKVYIQGYILAVEVLEEANTLAVEAHRLRYKILSDYSGRKQSHEHKLTEKENCK